MVIKKKSVEAINELPVKTRRIIHSTLATLEEDPYPGTGGDKERLHLDEEIDIFRLHIGKKLIPHSTPLTRKSKLSGFMT